MSESNSMRRYNIVVKNKPGELAKLTKFLADESIRVSALQVANCGDTASIQFSTPEDCDIRDGLSREGLKADVE